MRTFYRVLVFGCLLSGICYYFQLPRMPGSLLVAVKQQIAQSHVDILKKAGRILGTFNNASLGAHNTDRDPDKSHTTRELGATDSKRVVRWNTTGPSQGAGRVTSRGTSQAIPQAVRRCTQKERWQFIQSRCHQANYWTEPPFFPAYYRSPFIVSREAQVAYCSIPKNGCSAWKKLLTSTTQYGRQHGAARRDVHQTQVLEKWGLKQTSFGSLLNLFPNYTRIMVVRHPFDRLVSAYVDKLVIRKSDLYGKVGEYIVKQFRKGNVTHSMTSPTFLEFVHFLLSDSLYVDDRHWCPYGERCNPCYLDYDYVIRVESMLSDSQPILTQLGIQPEELDQHRHVHTEASVQHRNQQSTFRLTKITPKTLKEFQLIPTDTVHRLYQKYQQDFLLFGYDFHYDSSLATCQIHTNSGDLCC